MSKPRLRTRWPIAAVATTAALGALAWTSLAPAGAASAPDRVVVKTKGSGEHMHFALSDDSIQSGGNLVIKDKNGEPHTFSLVERDLIPRTNKQIANCFKQGHICSEIASWHQATGNKPPKVNPVDVGKPGWDREGNLHRTGDSVIFKPK